MVPALAGIVLDLRRLLVPQEVEYDERRPVRDDVVEDRRAIRASPRPNGFSARMNLSSD
jgi:hypothetical protein